MTAQTVVAEVVYPAGAFTALRQGLRIQGAVSEQELSLADAGRLVVLVNGRALDPSQVQIERMEWDGAGQLHVVMRLSNLTVTGPAQLKVATPNGGMALQAFVQVAQGGTAQVDVRSTAAALLMTGGAQPGGNGRGVELLTDWLSQAMASGRTMDAAFDQSLQRAVDTVQQASREGSLGAISVTNLQSGSTATTSTGGGGGGAVPTPPPPVSRATVSGIVYAEDFQRISDATVTARILGAGRFVNGSDTQVVTTQIGNYSVTGAPTGETLLVTVSKNGWTTRQQTIVPLVNPTGDPNLNKLVFGQDNAVTTFSLSDKPEVVSMTPQYNATGVDPATTLTLTFNEPVATADVESHFRVAVSTDNGAGYTLTAGNTLPQMYAPAADTFGGDAKVDAGESIFDASHFTFTWSNSNQTVTATFRPGVKLPTDKDSARLPSYAVGFAGTIRDAAGTGRTGAFFRVSAAQVGRNGYGFKVAADTTPPTIVSVRPRDVDALAVGTADRIRVTFSETMVLYTVPATIPQNGSVRTGGCIIYNGNLGGLPQAYGGDPTNATFEITPSTGSNATNQGFASGDLVTVTVTGVTDPAGNALSNPGPAGWIAGVI